MRNLASIADMKGGALAAAVAFMIFVAVTTAIVTRPVENFVRDLMMSTISPFTEPPPGIVVVAVDEATLATFRYRSPIDRGFLATLVTKIASGNPRAIGLDLLFDQATEPERDAALQSAIAKAGAPVVIASAWAKDGLSKKQLDYLSAFAPTAGRGLAALSRDPLDGVVRGAFAGREKDGEWQSGFSAALAEAGGIVRGREEAEMVYYRTANAEPYKFPVYPAKLAMAAPASWFTDKYVLIGVDLPLEDRHATPFVVLNGVQAGTLPGVVIHAHALARLISGDQVHTLGPLAGLALLLLGGAAAVWLSWRPMPVIYKPLATMAVLAVLWSGAAYAFSQYAIIVPLVAPSLLVAGLSAVTAFMAWRRDQAERAFVQRAFSQYVSPAVVDALVRDPGSLRLGGERRTVTCVFTDLEGFTHFSEHLPPEQLADVLNSYLDRVCDLFVEHGATIDKVIGDAVVGFFGAPAEQADQNERAVSLALAVERFSGAFQQEMRQRGVAMGVTRIGVHCGPAIVGNFGGKRFFDYTAIGDTVNTAARLEGANKYIGTCNCISSAVAGNANGHVLRPSGTLYLKGKNEGVETFEALNCSPESRTLAEAYGEAYALLAASDTRARGAFEQLSERYPGDRLIAFHRQRLADGEIGPAIRLSSK